MPCTPGGVRDYNDVVSEIVANLRDRLDDLYRTESRRVFATLVRLLGDFDLAEEAMHDAFASALKQWPTEGVPANPRAWLVSAGRFKAIDSMRRRARFDASLAELADRVDSNATAAADVNDGVEDDRLRLIFTCCHPALAAESQVALTLREVCGLTTEAIASAFLVTPATLAQRIVRAKSKIRDAGIPYQVPSREDLPERMETVLQVIYLVFNEGYSASSGESLTRPDLVGRSDSVGPTADGTAARAGGRLASSRSCCCTNRDEPREHRQTARSSCSTTRIVRCGTASHISEGQALVSRAMASAEIGPYSLQAAIAAVHADAASPDATDWGQIVALYDILAQIVPSPVVELNRAVAVAMRDGPAVGSGANRCHSGPRRIGRISPGPRRPGRSVPPAGPNGRRPHGLSAGSGPCPPGAGTAVSRGAVGGIGLKIGLSRG